MTRLAGHTYARHVQVLEHRARTEAERSLQRALERPSSRSIERRFDVTDHEPHPDENP
ncbi:MAG TPA: hypothetical protein VFQ53_32980 [Kofleriaceae bacterium]|nr:hypothetical protein [Kofleriaceae bacterium]